MKIARVFPTETSMSPKDEDAYFGEPDLFTPYYDEVHISVVFTWDVEKAELLQKQWEHIAPIKIGGPALNGEGDEFIPGMYLKDGITITSRGCPNRCSWCFIKKPLKELEIKSGNNVIDNNLLACSEKHLNSVFDMLSKQKNINFSGGLEASRITDKVAERIRGLNINLLYTAYDHSDKFGDIEKAFRILTKYFTRRYLRCYVLIGFGNDTMDKAEGRLMQVFELGGLPFAMLYRNKKGEYPQPEKEWKRFQRIWVRPEIIKTIMNERN